MNAVFQLERMKTKMACKTINDMMYNVLWNSTKEWKKSGTSLKKKQKNALPKTRIFQEDVKEEYNTTLHKNNNPAVIKIVIPSPPLQL